MFSLNLLEIFSCSGASLGLKQGQWPLSLAILDPLASIISDDKLSDIQMVVSIISKGHVSLDNFIAVPRHLIMMYLGVDSLRCILFEAHTTSLMFRLMS